MDGLLYLSSNTFFFFLHVARGYVFSLQRLFFFLHYAGGRMFITDRKLSAVELGEAEMISFLFLFLGRVC